MKVLLAVISGFFLTLLVFGAGALTTVFFVNAEPTPVRHLEMETSALWTNRAVKVNPATTGLQRSEPLELETRSKQDAGRLELDTVTTAGVSLPEVSEPQSSPNEAHIDWCFSRYQSYDPSDDSYKAYSGERRQCISPYSDVPDNTESYVEAAVYNAPAPAGAYEYSEHVQSCFDRYRSYRPEDNSYQPYGGGPRLQCQ